MLGKFSASPPGTACPTCSLSRSRPGSSPPSCTGTTPPSCSPSTARTARPYSPTSRAPTRARSSWSGPRARSRPTLRIPLSAGGISPPAESRSSCSPGITTRCFDRRPSKLWPRRSPKPPPSLALQQDERIDPRGPPGRDVAHQERQGPKTDDDLREGRGVGRRNLVEQPSEESGRDEREGEPEAQPQAGEQHPLPEHQPEDVSRPGAEGDPHPDLVVALTHGVGEDTVDADRSEEEPESG